MELILVSCNSYTIPYRKISDNINKYYDRLKCYTATTPNVLICTRKDHDTITIYVVNVTTDITSFDNFEAEFHDVYYKSHRYIPINIVLYENQNSAYITKLLRLILRENPVVQTCFTRIDISCDIKDVLKSNSRMQWEFIYTSFCKGCMYSWICVPTSHVNVYYKYLNINGIKSTSV